MPFTFLGALYTGAFKHYLPPCVYLQITNIKRLLFYITYSKISSVANKLAFTLWIAFIYQRTPVWYFLWHLKFERPLNCVHLGFLAPTFSSLFELTLFIPTILYIKTIYILCKYVYSPPLHILDIFNVRNEVKRLKNFSYHAFPKSRMFTCDLWNPIPRAQQGIPW